ncbi:MAG: hypothetical protein U0M00_01625 [Clostridia bacterium]|jgi:hypothetical protein|uniref:Uncharacterized protein n=2 Tax=unclassified Caudoviricetes TaxID=2788787 RepID=A0A8S5NJ28_9CAUD|nr:hypothetical protein [Clostridia bacterium]DAD94083.1 MAG TPA: hypothetical protein [Siphoviridae sp. ctUF252]DAE01513.1 MAG TPA: hypothetical protein [Siphoviridae sp. ctZHt25]
MATLTVIIVAMLSIILWHKKINPETSWIYGGYVLIIVTIYLFAVTSL